MQVWISGEISACPNGKFNSFICQVILLRKYIACLTVPREGVKLPTMGWKCMLLMVQGAEYQLQFKATQWASSWDPAKIVIFLK